MTKQQKAWYKKWWGVIIAILIWPFFLLWFVWAKTKWHVALKILSTAVLVIVAFFDVIFWIAIGMAPSMPSTNTTTSTPTTQATPKPTVKDSKTTVSSPAPTPAPKPSSTPAPKPTTTPTPAHTIVYQFSLMSGKMTADDIQNVGISWHDPTTGDNKVPDDIAGAIQQINAGSYSVTYHVDSVNTSNLSAGVNNYNDPDATIACSILVDNNPIATEVAPKNGYSLCSGISADNQSGT